MHHHPKARTIMTPTKYQINELTGYQSLIYDIFIALNQPINIAQIN